MTTLITGGSGFLGSYIIPELLARGEEVVNGDLRDISGEQAWLLGEAREKVRFVPFDVTDMASMVEALVAVRPDRVIHTAGLMVGEHRRILSVNLTGTLNLLEACRIAGVKKFVFFSSVGVLPPAQYEPLDVRHPVLLPDQAPFNSFYSASKLAGELTCWAYKERFGMDFAVIRPCTVYGFGEGPNLGIRPMIENALAGRPTRIASGESLARSYTHAADVAAVTVLATLQPAEAVKDHIFFGGTDGPMQTLGEIAGIIRNIIPGADIEVGSELTDSQRREGIYRKRVNIDNAREQLGYDPRYRDMADGLAATVEKYRGWNAHQAAKA